MAKKSSNRGSGSAGRKEQSAFTKFARLAACWAGRPLIFGLACGLVLVWALMGPVMDYSDSWQLTINTGTTIVTFLMVFLIQNTQNRDSEALQIKLDEIISAFEQTNKALLDLEELDEQVLEEIRAEYVAVARKARGEK